MGLFLGKIGVPQADKLGERKFPSVVLRSLTFLENWMWFSTTGA